ncbi:MAG TPA: Zn-dependent alcohol dehydrogenase [Candidatus Eisenbacteria bacterium]|nr:Zn-dependent alcohol dehydrogenase [Candidatus Eisenbacteria bacterium]
MRAAVLYEPGAPLRVEEVELAPPRAGEVRVRVAAAGVCHSDYHYMRGDLTTNLPVVLGHEGAGVVEEVGPGVTAVAPGDPVVLLWRTSCGRCEYCSAGRPALCPAGLAIRASGRMADGTSRLSRGGEEIRHFLGVSCFAEHVVCSERAALRIPDDVPLPVAAVAGCAVMTGVGAVVNTARVEAGSSVLVIGAGGVGLCAIMGAVLAGAARIVAADLSPAKLELATQFGATDVVDASRDDVVEAVRELTGGVDYAFEVIGLPQTVAQAVRAVRAGGTAVAVGVAPVGAATQVDLLELVLQEKTLKGSIYGSTRPQADFPRLFELYRRGRLPLDRLLTREWPLERVNEAYDALIEGGLARSVIVMRG